MKLILCGLTLSILLIKINGYFYEHKLSVISIEHKGSMFGYGMAYQHTDVYERFLVSAPTADKVGQIFNCSLNNFLCEQVPIEVNGHRESSEEKKEYNHNYLLGASLVADSNNVITCAPRITENFQYKHIDMFGTFGKCFYSSNSSNHFKIMYYEDSEQRAKDEQIVNGFGWSAHITKKEEVAIGGPPMGKGRVLYYPSVKDDLHILKGDTKITATYNYGYGITSGKFLKKNDILFAISSPFETVGYGKIFIIQKRDTQILRKKILKDKNVGSLFGASMCAADLDNDGIDELLVGAPTYQKLKTHQWNIGAVHIYFKKIVLKKSLIGYVKNGYFGTSIINIGDQNGDRCDDICVGAPYEDNGVVYVYSGADLISDQEKNIMYLQRIKPETSIGFGHSITLLPNFENNACSGISVGAPDSDSVFIVHCIPMVKLTLKTDFPNINELPIDETKFDIKSCFEVVYPPKLQNVIADIVVRTKIEHEIASVAHPNVPNVNNTNQYEMKLKIDITKYCKNVTVKIPEGGDYSKLLKYSIQAELKENPAKLLTYDPFRVTLSPESKIFDEGIIPAMRGCSGTSCVSVLYMTMHHNIPERYMLGSTEKQSMYVIVRSSGETAYLSCVRINIKGVSVLKYPPVCRKDKNHKTTLTCSSRKPLFNNKTWNTGNITLDMKTLTSAHKDIILTAYLYYNCNKENKTTSTNTIELIANTSRVEIKSTSSFDHDIKFFSSDFKIDKKPMEHSFMITNNGIVTWEGLQAILTLEREKNLKIVGVKVDNIDCELPSHFEKGTINVVCPLPILNVNNSIFILIQMDILTNNLESLLKVKNITIETIMKIDFRGTYMNSSISNVLVYQLPTAVPFWIILVSSLVGLIILLLIGYGMSEAGFFKRQNKAKLHTLKLEVRRQSIMRQSIKLEARQSLKPSTPYHPDDNIQPQPE